MMTPHLNEHIARQRAAELRHAAERERLARSLSPGGPHPLERLFGELLARLARGRRLPRGLPAPHPTRPHTTPS
jgi:hypothetical protein